MRASVVGRGPLLVVVCVALALVDCSSHVCTPGQSVACTGPAGCSGAQVCTASGSAFEQCVCGTTGDGGTDGGRDGGNDGGADAGQCEACRFSTDERCWGGVCTKFVRVNLDYRRSYYSGMSCVTPACNVSHEADGGQAAQLRGLLFAAGCTVDTVAGSVGVPPVINIGCTDQCAPNALMCCTWFPPDAGHEACGWAP